MDTNTLYQTDPVSGDAIIEVVWGESFGERKTHCTEKGEVLRPIRMILGMKFKIFSGAVYEVYAAEDIYTADFRKMTQEKESLEYAKGAKLQN